MSNNDFINIIGGGLAGSEAAWQAARRGLRVRLFEMRPNRATGAHRTGNLAELVCSNSLKSHDAGSAPRLLTDELLAAGSLLLRLAREVAVPAGGALAVDREKFSALVTETLSNHPNIELRREEVAAINPDGPDEITVIAAGPLASPALVSAIGGLTRGRDLYFFGAMSPVVDGETINYRAAVQAGRLGTGAQS